MRGRARAPTRTASVRSRCCSRSRATVARNSSCTSCWMSCSSRVPHVVGDSSTKLGACGSCDPELRSRERLDEQPRPPLSQHRAPFGEVPERERHGRAARPHQRAERLVGEGQRQHGAAGRHAAPLLGEQPEQGEEPILDAWQLADRELHRDTLDLLGRAGVEAGDEARPAVRPDEHVLAQHGEVGGGHRAAPGVDQQHRRGSGARGDDVAGPEDPHAGLLADAQVRDEHAADDEGAEARIAVEQRADVDVPRLERHDRHGERLGRGALLRSQVPADVGVGLQQRNPRGGHEHEPTPADVHLIGPGGPCGRAVP